MRNVNLSYGQFMRDRVSEKKILPLIGVYDALSASLATKYYDAIFCSGYGFSASKYGLPDEGFIAWLDMISYVENLRFILPDTHIIVDIDDGYADIKLAQTVVKRLENVGASAVILEDQRRPKKCGHLPGKEVLETHEYLEKLHAVLNVRKELFVIARTDATTLDEGIKRVNAYAKAGADAVMVEGLDGHDAIEKVRKGIPKDTALTVNLISGGKTGPISLCELEQNGVNLVVYSTPCLFAAHKAIDNAMKKLVDNDGRLEGEEFGVNLKESNGVLSSNLLRGIDLFN